MSPTLAYPFASCTWRTADPVLHVRRERTFLRLPLPDEMDPNTHLGITRPGHRIVPSCTSTCTHMARDHGGFIFLGLLREEHH